MSYPSEKGGHQQAPPVYTQHAQIPSHQQGMYDHSSTMQQQQQPLAFPQYYQQAQHQPHMYMNAMQTQSMPSVYQQQVPLAYQSSPVPATQLPLQPQMLYLSQPTYMGQAPPQHTMLMGMPSVPPIVPGIKPSRRIIATIIHMLIIIAVSIEILNILGVLATNLTIMGMIVSPYFCLINVITSVVMLWISFCAVQKPAFLLRPFKEMKKVFVVALVTIIIRWMTTAYIFPFVLVVPNVIFSILYLYGITKGLDPESSVGYFFVPFRPYGLQ